MTDQTSKQEPWNQTFADGNLCPYCGTINWERKCDFDWDNRRQECKCELCGAGWWEVLVPTPKSPSQALSEEAVAAGKEAEPTTSTENHATDRDKLLHELYKQHFHSFYDATSYNFANRSITELFALGHHFINSQFSAWLWIMQPRYITGNTLGRADYREIIYWDAELEELCRTITSKLNLQDPGAGKDLLKMFCCGEIELIQRLINLLCRGRLDILHDVFGWYREDYEECWVEKLMIQHWYPDELVYPGNFFTLPSSFIAEFHNNEEPSNGQPEDPSKLMKELAEMH